MTTRKHQNSILVLATLGVYLGLVLVGATPQVWAQAAMTKQFKVNDEIATEEDIDLGPDGNQVLSNYAEVVQSLYSAASIVAVESEHVKDDSDYSLSGFVRRSPRSYFSFRSHQPKSFYSGGYTSPLLSVLKTFPFAGEPDTEKLYVSFRLGVDKFDLGIKLNVDTLSSAIVGRLATKYSTALEEFNSLPTTPAKRLILENTQVSLVDKQIFIVTRLPRAGLDALLTSNA